MNRTEKPTNLPDDETLILRIGNKVLALEKLAEEGRVDFERISGVKEFIRNYGTLRDLLNTRRIEKIPRKPLFANAICKNETVFSDTLRYKMATVLGAKSDLNIVVTVEDLALALKESPQRIKNTIPALRKKISELGIELKSYNDVPWLDNRGWKDYKTGWRLAWKLKAKQRAQPEEARGAANPTDPPSNSHNTAGRPPPRKAIEVIGEPRLGPNPNDRIDYRNIPF